MTSFTSRPVLIIFSILAGAQILVAGAALGHLIGPDVAAFLALVVAAVQGGMTFYVQGQVTSNAHVVAQVTPEGDVVAGAAATQATGSKVAVVGLPVVAAPAHGD